MNGKKPERVTFGGGGGPPSENECGITWGTAFQAEWERAWLVPRRERRPVWLDPSESVRR